MVSTFNPMQISGYEDDPSEGQAVPNPEVLPTLSRGQAAGVSAQQGLTLGYGPEGEAYRTAFDKLKDRGEIAPPEFPANPGIGAPPVILPYAIGFDGKPKDLRETPEYKDTLQDERARVRAARQQYPYTSFGAEVAGSLPVAAVGPELKAGQFFGNIARRGIPAGAQVAAYNEPKKPYEPEDTWADTAMKFGEGFVAGNVLAPIVNRAATATADAGKSLLDAAKRLMDKGVPIPDIPKYLTTNSDIARWLSQTLAKTPVSGGPLNKAATEYEGGLGATKQGVTDIVNPSLPNQTIYDAGRTVQNDIGGWVDRQRQYFDNQYNRVLTSIIDPNQRVPMSNASNALSDIVQRRASMGPGVFDFNNPRDVRKATSGIVQHVMDALDDPQGKSFWQLKELRTHLRELYGNPANNISKTEYDKLYKALSDDMEDAARLSGNSNYREYKRVDSEYKKNIEDIDDFQSFFGNFEKVGGNYKFDKTPEQLIGIVQNAMRDGKGGSYDKVVSMMRVLSPRGRDAMRKTIIDSLGREPSKVAPDVYDFNPLAFMKQYGSLSQKAKTDVFGADLKQSLDDLYTLSSPMSKGAKNSIPSITSPLGAEEQASEIKVILSAAAHPFASLAGLVGGRAFASAMANPADVKGTAALVRATRALAQNPASEAVQRGFVAALRQAPVVFSEQHDITDYARAIGVGSAVAAKLKALYSGKEEGEEAAPHASGGRVGRKSGGRIKSNPISAEVKRIRALLSHKTASMLSLPDDAVATALKIAKGH